jgi:hypothetical protein
MGSHVDNLEPFRAAPVGQVPGDLWYAVFQGDRMVSSRAMSQEEEEAEADRMNAEALNPDMPGNESA